MAQKLLLKVINISVIILLLVACEKEIVKVADPGTYNSSASGERFFRTFWNYMNNNYMFWDEDPTNWDSVYIAYHPLCSKLDLNKAVDMQTMMSYLRKATDKMIDGHMYIQVNYSVYPGLLNDAQTAYTYDSINGYKIPKCILAPVTTQRIKSGTYQPEKFVVDSLANHYLDPTTKQDFNYGGGFFVAPWRLIVSLTSSGQALYIHFDSFAIQQYTSDYGFYAAANAYNSFLTYARDAKKLGLKGIIIDLRGNGGGDIRDLNFLSGRLVDHNVTFGYNRYKNGDNRKDYTPWLPAVLHPNPAGSFAVDVPIVLLVDQNSVSMSEITTFALKAAYPQTTKIVGKTTWGGHGGLTDIHQFNAGVGYVGNANQDVFFYTPVTAFKFIDGIMREGKGITPDVDVDLDAAQYKKGIDTQFEAALKLLNK